MNADYRDLTAKAWRRLREAQDAFTAAAKELEDARSNVEHVFAAKRKAERAAQTA